MERRGLQSGRRRERREKRRKRGKGIGERREESGEEPKGGEEQTDPWSRAICERFCRKAAAKCLICM